MDKITIERETLERAKFEAWLTARDNTMRTRLSLLLWECWRAALAAQPAPAVVPPEYALVPIEPTPEMVDAGDVARHSVVTQARTSVIYRAMIAAAGDKI